MHVVRSSDNYSLFSFKLNVFLDAMLCNRNIDVSGGNCYNIIEKTDTSETTIHMYTIVRGPNPKYGYLSSQCCENLKSQVIFFVYRCH
jgi:hypothetical protein